MNIPANLKYSNDHEWVRVEGNEAFVGITDFAQGQLGDIVFVDVPTVGESLGRQDRIRRIPSRKRRDTRIQRSTRKRPGPREQGPVRRRVDYQGQHGQPRRSGYPALGRRLRETRRLIRAGGEAPFVRLG